LDSRIRYEQITKCVINFSNFPLQELSICVIANNKNDTYECGNGKPYKYISSDIYENQQSLFAWLIKRWHIEIVNQTTNKWELYLIIDINFSNINRSILRVIDKKNCHKNRNKLKLLITGKITDQKGIINNIPLHTGIIIQQ
jgi:hypothetical protein